MVEWWLMEMNGGFNMAKSVFFGVWYGFLYGFIGIFMVIDDIGFY